MKHQNGSRRLPADARPAPPRRFLRRKGEKKGKKQEPQTNAMKIPQRRARFRDLNDKTLAISGQIRDGRDRHYAQGSANTAAFLCILSAISEAIRL
jgi:hypothetical protein